MRFMMLVIPKGYENAAPGTMPDAKMVEKMMKYNEELQKAGVLLDGTGLQPSSKGFKVKYTGKKRTIVDGPFTEAKELVAGYSIIQTKTREEAKEWARRFPNPTIDGSDTEIEVRQLFELEDFAPGEAIDHHKELWNKVKK
jgi:hypothetical protein